MKDFLKIIDYRHVLPLYVIIFLILTLIGQHYQFDYYGTEFSLPIIIVSLMIDLFVLYRIYKKNS
jgi:general stress protein CsbA